MTINNNSRTMASGFDIFAEDSRGGYGMVSVLDLCTKNQKAIHKFQSNIEWMVEEEKVKTFYELTDSDQKELVGLLLAALDDQTEWFGECKDADVIMNSLSKYMATQSQADRDYFLNVMQANAIKYWAEHIDDLIASSYAAHQRNKRNDGVDYQIEQRLAAGF